MLLYIMLYIMLAYLILLAALSNAVSLHDAYLLYLFIYFVIDFCKCFFFMLCLGLLTHSLFISGIILHSAFNLLVFPNSMFTPFFTYLLKGYVLSGEIALQNNHYYYYYYYCLQVSM